MTIELEIRVGSDELGNPYPAEIKFGSHDMYNAFGTMFRLYFAFNHSPNGITLEPYLATEDGVRITHSPFTGAPIKIVVLPEAVQKLSQRYKGNDFVVVADQTPIEETAQPAPEPIEETTSHSTVELEEDFQFEEVPPAGQDEEDDDVEDDFNDLDDAYDEDIDDFSDDMFEENFN